MQRQQSRGKRTRKREIPERAYVGLNLNYSVDPHTAHDFKNRKNDPLNTKPKRD